MRMMSFPLLSLTKLRLLGVMSSIALLCALSAPVAAHEVRPAVADVRVSADQVEIDLTHTIEALVVGLNLAGVEDTDDTPDSAQYDAARALPPAELVEVFTTRWEQIGTVFTITLEDGTDLSPELVEVQVPAVGDVDIPRDSTVKIRAALPAGDTAVQVGWDAANGPLIVRQIAPEAEEPYSAYLNNGGLSDPLPRTGVAELNGVQEFGRYIVSGFDHILPKGLDHILFVLGLFFFSLKARPLLIQVTTFTIAHSVTLALAALGLVNIPGSIVEPLIAASIVFVALENLRGGAIGPVRIGVVFVFGLLHGLGFASVLGEFGLNPSRLVMDLIAFNIGVELGQLTVIALAYIAVGFWFGDRDWYRARIANPVSILIALVGAWWVVERTLL